MKPWPNKIDRWESNQYYNNELKKAKARRGCSGHPSDCDCRGCKDSRSYAYQES